MTAADLQPRVLTRAEAARYCGLSAEGFSDWVGSGKLPKALPGTRRWDRRALDAALDRMSGFLPSGGAAADPMSALDEWKAKRNGGVRAR